jgi:hypothetical protein
LAALVTIQSNKSLQQKDEKTMSGIFSDNFLSLLSPLATAQYRPTPTATFPNPAAPAPGPLPIPPAQPPIFLSPPDPAGAAPAQPTSAFGGIGNAITSGINNHALTLMALGAGIAQGGVGKGLAAAATAAEAERNRQAQQLNFLQTYQALTDGGVPPQEAQAAIGNPSLMRALAAKYLGSRSSGNAANSAAAPPASAPAIPASASTASSNASSASAPALPPNVPSGARYSPSRNLWRDPDGNRFDQQGKTLR